MSKLNICLVSSSGGHYEQLRMLAPLGETYDLFWVTEKTDYESTADYYVWQTGLKDLLFPFKLIVNMVITLRIFLKERPDVVITTGTMAALPFALLAKWFRKKLVYIETFARVHDSTKTGRKLYKHADLFIYQWEGLKDIYPNGVYGGSIY